MRRISFRGKREKNTCPGRRGEKALPKYLGASTRGEDGMQSYVGPENKGGPLF